MLPIRKCYNAITITITKASIMAIDIRQRFMLLKVFWEGEISRKDLSDRFDLSPTQATTDFRLLRKNFPDAVSYDSSIRRYLPGSQIQEYVDAYTLDEYHSMAGEATISAEIVRPASKPVDPITYRTLFHAMNNTLGLEVAYRSIRDPEASIERILYPHTFVRSGHRWHVRAYDANAKAFKDFNLSRIKSLKTSEKKIPAAGRMEKDKDWHEIIEVWVTPNMSLSANQRQLIAAEYVKPPSLILDLHVRAALLLYALHQYEIYDFSDEPPVSQLLQIGNPDKVRPHLPGQAKNDEAEEDAELAAIVRAREGQPRIAVDWDDL